MEKTTFIAVTVHEDGKYYSYAIKTKNNNNLLSVLNIKGIVSANVCDTFKKAREIVDYWNECYKRNGTYMFADGPAF